jgi:chromosome segregation ATPase
LDCSGIYVIKLTMADAKKLGSPLVQTVVALDEYFSELERVGNKIATMDLKTDSDFEQARRLMSRFAECGEGVTAEVTALSRLLGEARARSEVIAHQVEARTAELSSRRDEKQELTDQFTALTLQVRDLGTELNSYKRDESTEITDDDRAQIAAQLSSVGLRLGPMIAEAQRLRKEARLAKMKSLDQNADSLTQTLQALQTKLNGLDLPPAAQA